MTTRRKTSADDRSVGFRAIVDIPILLDAQGCVEALELADSLQELEDRQLLQHLCKLRKEDKERLRSAWVARRSRSSRTQTRAPRRC